MTPEISEFSHGFALTNEIVAWAPLRFAPVFPSLIEEGKKGGGYDVKLDMPGVPLYLQFKRGYRMTRRTAKEIQQHKKPLKIPFHRFYITDSGTSDQHVMLLELDDGQNDVFYAAPRFDRIFEINRLWVAKEVAERSIFVRPQVIGELDDDLHHVAYDDDRAFLCSEPKEIEATSAAQLVQKLQRRLQGDSRPIRDTLLGYSANADRAARRGETKIQQRGMGGVDTTEIQEADDFFYERVSPTSPAQRVPLRESAQISEASQRLRNLADTAYLNFNVQLVIVQPTDRE